MLISGHGHKQHKWMAWPSHRSSRLLSTGLEAHLLLWLKGKRGKLTMNLPVLSCRQSGRFLGPQERPASSSHAKETGTWGLAAPELAQAFIFSCSIAGEMDLKSEAKCHIARPLKSGLRETENDCQSVSCFPNPLLNLKLSFPQSCQTAWERLAFGWVWAGEGEGKRAIGSSQGLVQKPLPSRKAALPLVYIRTAGWVFVWWLAVQYAGWQYTQVKGCLKCFWRFSSSICYFW